MDGNWEMDIMIVGGHVVSVVQLQIVISQWTQLASKQSLFPLQCMWLYKPNILQFSFFFFFRSDGVSFGFINLIGSDPIF